MLSIPTGTKGKEPTMGALTEYLKHEHQAVDLVRTWVRWSQTRIEISAEVQDAVTDSVLHLLRGGVTETDSIRCALGSLTLDQPEALTEALSAVQALGFEAFRWQRRTAETGWRRVWMLGHLAKPYAPLALPDDLDLIPAAL